MLPKYSHNTFILVRHGEAENNVQRVLNGRIEGGPQYSLTERGKNQIAQAAQFLKKYPIDFLVTSPLQRTRETTAILNKVFEVPVSYDERLCEAQFGEFEETNIDHFLDFMAKHGGRNIGEPERGVEGFMDIRERIRSFLTDLSAHFTGKTIVIVSHADPLQEMYGELMQIPAGIAQGGKGWAPQRGSCAIVSADRVEHFDPEA